MTTQTAKTYAPAHSRNMDGEMIHTPPIHQEVAEAGAGAALSSSPAGMDAGMHMSSSPLSSPKLMKHELSYSKPPETLDGLEKKKRKYSADIFKWTQEMWENARQDIERRSSVSSTNSSSTDGAPSSPKA